MTRIVEHLFAVHFEQQLVRDASARSRRGGATFVSPALDGAHFLCTTRAAAAHTQVSTQSRSPHPTPGGSNPAAFRNEDETSIAPRSP